MVNNRSEAALAARAEFRRGRRHPDPTGARANTRALAVPHLQHNGPDVEHDSNEGRVQSPETISDGRAQTDLKDSLSHPAVGDALLSADTTTQASLGHDNPTPNPTVGDVGSHTSISVQLGTTRLRRFNSGLTKNIPAGNPAPVHRMPQKEQEQESESESEPEPTPSESEIIHRIRPARGPDVEFLGNYAHNRRLASLPRPRSAAANPSSPLRSAEMLALATTHLNGTSPARDRLFNRVANKAVEKFLRFYYPGVELGQFATQMIMAALRRGWRATGATWRALEPSLRKVIPRTLATIRKVLTAEKTPKGSDHAPIPGAYPIMPEVPAAAEANPVDRVELEPASRLESRLTRPEGAALAEMRTSEESPPKTRTPGLLRNTSSEASGLALKETRPAYEKWKSELPAMHRFSSQRPGLFMNAFGTTAHPVLSKARLRELFPRLYNPRRPPASFQGPLSSGWSKQQSIMQHEQHTIWQSASFAQFFGLSLSEVNQPRQLDCLGPYWARRLSPFLGVDGKELPMLGLTPSQLEFCRALAQLLDPMYTVVAVVMLRGRDGQLLLAMRLEAVWSPLWAERGLVTAGSSDDGSTWDYIKATGETGGPTQTLHLSESYKELIRLQNESSDPMVIDGGDCSGSFLLGDYSLAKGSVVYHEDFSVSFFLADGSTVDGSAVRALVMDSSVMAVPTDVSMADAFD